MTLRLAVKAFRQNVFLPLRDDRRRRRDLSSQSEAVISAATPDKRSPAASNLHLSKF